MAETLKTLVPSASFDLNQIMGLNPAVSQPVVSGGISGVPPNAGLAQNYSDPNQNNKAQAAASYGRAVVQQGVFRQPVFWYVILLVLSLWMFAHMARLESL